MSNVNVKIQMALQVPENAGKLAFRSDEWPPKLWPEKKAFLFDDSFLHEVPASAGPPR